MLAAEWLHVSNNTNQNLPTLNNYVGCLEEELQRCLNLLRESMDVEHERQKSYYDRSTSGAQYEVGDLVMVFNPTTKPDQTKKSLQNWMTQKEEKLILKGLLAKIKPSSEIYNETVKDELFETPMGGSTRESIKTNTNNKSRSTEVHAPKVAMQQKRDSLVATSERSEGEEFPYRSRASTSQNVTKRRCQTRSALGKTKPLKLKYYFLIKDSDLDEKFDNDVFFKNVIRQSTEGVKPTMKRAAELKTSPIG